MKKSSFSEKISCGDFGQLVDARVSCGKEGGYDCGTLLGQDIAMGAGEFLDQSVSTEERQLAGYFGCSFLLVWLGGLTFQEQGPEVTIPKSVDLKFAAIDGLE